MSSGLLTYASPWEMEANSRYNSTVRKRVSTLPTPACRNKTIKKTPSLSLDLVNADEYPSADFDNYSSKENFQDGVNPSPAQAQAQTPDRTTRVQEIINNMGSMQSDNDGTNLVNFTAPISNTKKPDVKPIVSSYGTNENPLANSFGSYKDVYNANSNIAEYSYKPYQGAPTPVTSMNTDSVMEKMNYMIHLLEEQQLEPTKYVTEEFILYTFLGIFVIYIVDSFARVGKYIR